MNLLKTKFFLIFCLKRLFTQNQKSRFNKGLLKNYFMPRSG
jgi:hypothetical protein